MTEIYNNLKMVSIHLKMYLNADAHIVRLNDIQQLTKRNAEEP